MDFQKQ